jgi:hypothetical protein
MRGLKDIDYVLAKLAFIRNERIWTNGLRYLWTEPSASFSSSCFTSN